MLVINCLCGDSRQVLESRASPAPLLLISDIDEERHGSGVLFVSHCLVEPPDQEALSRLAAYDHGDRITRFFCRRCGCHVFRRRSAYDLASKSIARSMRDWSPSSTTATAGGNTPATGSPRASMILQTTPVGDGAPAAVADTYTAAPTLTGVYSEYGMESFAVATGIICESPAFATDGDANYLGHSTVDTIDGGLAPWLSLPKMEGRTQVRTPLHVEPSSQAIPAFCQCGKVQLQISRPQDVFPTGGARYPYSPYPDLIYPFKTTPRSTLDNPSDEKWYLRHDNTKYLAGTCACRSCRLITGYEIQNWAFIPRAAIRISVTSRPPSSPFSSDYSPPDPDTYIPLDFEELDRRPANPLRSYESSPGVFREFCPGCGATVFWHAKARPDLIDVSVGLFHASEGARAESLLEWWRDRCSFAEDAGLDRTGWVKGWAEALIGGLEQGLKK